MTKINYQQKLDEYLKTLPSLGRVQTLLLHSCCGPCSSYVLEYLCKYFDVTVLYFNPNIRPKEEYEKRKAEQMRLISEMRADYKICILDCGYSPEVFNAAAKGLEHEPEGGARCVKCFDCRLRYTAEMAKQNGFDLFCTTLTVSPHKNSQLINKIGETLEKEYGTKWLPSDFKKREGYKRSIELSKEYNLYRQSYCGCMPPAESVESKDS